MKTPNTICTDKERLKEKLTQFAIAVNRQVCMRIGGFKPANESEWQQQREGVPNGGIGCGEGAVATGGIGRVTTSSFDAAVREA